MDRSRPPHLTRWQFVAPYVVAMALPLYGQFAQGSPAAWYLWQSKLDGKVACVQTSPGPGWNKLAGPFADARCGRAN